MDGYDGVWKGGQPIDYLLLPCSYMNTYMVGGSFFPVHGPSDIHPARHGVNIEDLHRGLVRSHTCDAVPDGDIIVLVRPDLKDIRMEM